MHPRRLLILAPLRIDAVFTIVCRPFVRVGDPMLGRGKGRTRESKRDKIVIERGEKGEGRKEWRKRR